MAKNSKNEFYNSPEDAPDGQILIYNDGGLNLQVRLDGRTVWLPQRLIAELFQTTVANVNMHLASIYGEGELDSEATIKNYLIVQTEGERKVSRSIEHYNLDAILAVGYRVRSARGTQFRQWATARLSELLVKGFTMDAERIKAGLTMGDDYFDELLEQIRDIRSSERMFYQKITDIYTTSIDYDSEAPITQKFFATVQNKLHWAIHGHTAAEVIVNRASAEKPNMGLTTWKNAPKGAIRKSDVRVAKNYLSQEELAELNRIVSMYLDFAEDQAKRHKPMHMKDWAEKLDAFLKFNDREILLHAGEIAHEAAIVLAETEFEKYAAERRRIADKEEKSDFDKTLEKVQALDSGSGKPKPKLKPKPKPKQKTKQEDKD